ncbi:hypothetical protein [Hymenobacter negativus]|uniref:Uncharacterized protein n=1 Tax=Hymenobacter negativus TaxID=2795026 RepID=A0ABS0Q917_9BACT|nr:hypothetical protein [Hymenobacter negativus]MBH8558957.1 hypothetical protein [Hymenobacter negativus]
MKAPKMLVLLVCLGLGVAPSRAQLSQQNMQMLQQTQQVLQQYVQQELQQQHQHNNQNQVMPPMSNPVPPVLSPQVQQTVEQTNQALQQRLQQFQQNLPVQQQSRDDTGPGIQRPVQVPANFQFQKELGNYYCIQGQSSVSEQDAEAKAQAAYQKLMQQGGVAMIIQNNEGSGSAIMGAGILYQVQVQSSDNYYAQGQSSLSAEQALANAKAAVENGRTTFNGNGSYLGPNGQGTGTSSYAHPQTYGPGPVIRIP